MTIYDIKPRFQALLRPLTKRMATAGITANQVTIAAALGSLLVGAVVIMYAHISLFFLLIPLWMFLRMALNAIDGMLAREFNQKSKLGACLNEITDVISDAALYLPFAYVAPFTLLPVAIVIFLASLSEYAGLLGLTIGASRRYDGPLGKSDRAFVFGALGLWVGIGASLPAWLYWLMPCFAVLIAITIVNRIKQALMESSSPVS